jgi:hypothetical protein
LFWVFVDGTVVGLGQDFWLKMEDSKRAARKAKRESKFKKGGRGGKRSKYN